MIRIYLDWDVISKYKKDEFKEIREFILQHKDYLQFPYTPTHFKDLMKSYTPDNACFEQDLQNLDYLSENHYMAWGQNGLEVLFQQVHEYFEYVKQQEDIFSMMDIDNAISIFDNNEIGIGKIGNLLKTMLKQMPTGIDVNDESRELLQKMFPNLGNNSSMWDLMKGIAPFSKQLLTNGNYYKDLRKSINDKGFKLEQNSGNWIEEQVIKKIDDFLQAQTTKLTFRECVNTCFQHKKEPVNKFEYFTSAYLLLDMIGYKSDALKKPINNMQNIQNDSEHSFYAAHCDYFVVIDKKLAIKAKVLFREFNIPTKVISPSEFIYEIKSKIHVVKDDFISEVYQFLSAGEYLEFTPKGDDMSADSYAFKLPLFYFNFFNYVILQKYENNAVAFTFRKVFKNYSSFVYYTESEIVIERINKYFGYDNDEAYKKNKKEFVYGEKPVKFVWKFDGGLIILEKETDTHRPILTYFMVPHEPNEG